MVPQGGTGSAAGLNQDNWKTQIRKGYLELCILLLIKRHQRIYGFDLLEKLSEADLPVKDGTLYPLLNRMTVDGVLSSSWDIENVKGHPRKFYSLTKAGNRVLDEMSEEFERMFKIFKGLGH
jgi:PadR family transcriptional regulator, regulatory protein PadR